MIDFGIAHHIEARSSGERGQRLFHLRILGEPGKSASLKIEKEHLLGLHSGLRGILSELKYQAESEAGAGVVYFPQTPEYDFPVGHVGMGFSPAEKMVVLHLEELQTEDGQDLALLRVRFTPAQGVTLVRQLENIMNAGRPICPLCSQPVDPAGHVCIRSNGHSQEPVPEPPDADEEGDEH